MFNDEISSSLRSVIFHNKNSEIFFDVIVKNLKRNNNTLTVYDDIEFRLLGFICFIYSDDFISWCTKNVINLNLHTSKSEDFVTNHYFFKINDRFHINTEQIDANSPCLDHTLKYNIDLDSKNVFELFKFSMIEYREFLSSMFRTGCLLSTRLNDILNDFGLDFNILILFIFGFNDINYLKLLETASEYKSTKSSQELQTEFDACKLFYNDLYVNKHDLRFIILGNNNVNVFKIRNAEVIDLVYYLYKTENIFSSSFNSGRGFKIKTFLIAGMFVLNVNEDKLDDYVQLCNENIKNKDIDLSNKINIIDS